MACVHRGPFCVYCLRHKILFRKNLHLELNFFRVLVTEKEAVLPDCREIKHIKEILMDRSIGFALGAEIPKKLNVKHTQANEKATLSHGDDSVTVSLLGGSSADHLLLEILKLRQFVIDVKKKTNYRMNLVEDFHNVNAIKLAINTDKSSDLLDFHVQTSHALYLWPEYRSHVETDGEPFKVRTFVKNKKDACDFFREFDPEIGFRLYSEDRRFIYLYLGDKTISTWPLTNQGIFAASMESLHHEMCSDRQPDMQKSIIELSALTWVADNNKIDLFVRSCEHDRLEEDVVNFYLAESLVKKTLRRVTEDIVKRKETFNRH